MAIGAFALGACLAPGVVAADKKAPPALETARKAMASAIGVHDLGRILEMSQFPLAVEMANFPRTIPATRFRSDKTVFVDLFGEPDTQTVRCIASGPLARQDDPKQFGFRSWFIDCNGNEYFFSFAQGVWRFSAYENVNE